MKMVGLAVVTVLVLLAMTFVVGEPAAPRSDAHALLHVHDSGGPCRCTEARMVNGWCGPCRVGYVGGVKITSANLFEAVDAHGHEFQPASIECATCRRAIVDGGFCETCQMGFLNGKLWATRLTWWLAHGRIVDTAATSCDGCRSNATRHGWCDRCGTGMVGNVAFGDRAQTAAAGRELDRLLRSIEIGKTCDNCGVASFFDVPCFQCGIAYTNGTGVKMVDPPGSS